MCDKAFMTFFRACVNAICDGKSFPLCPQCLLPVGLQHVKSATFADQIFQNLLFLKEALTKVGFPAHIFIQNRTTGKILD